MSWIFGTEGILPLGETGREGAVVQVSEVERPSSPLVSYPKLWTSDLEGENVDVMS